MVKRIERDEESWRDGGGEKGVNGGRKESQRKVETDLQIR